jgi:alkaline phosphatase D
MRGSGRRSAVNRRQFLRLGGMTGVALLAGNGALQTERARASARFRDYPFTLGVASGDPRPDGVVLWTRLAPDPLAEDGSGGMPPESFGVRFEIATDGAFRKIVRRGAVEATPQLAHSVHPEISGLQPGRDYYYRFMAGREVSPVGRTRTAPAVGSALSSLAFAFASCQKWDEGFYTAYRHMAADDLDLVVHLGDYIYENGVSPTGGVRNQPVPAYLGGETFDLTRYRLQYALYKSDADLQAAHAAFPWVVTLDDHDVENNWADGISQVDGEPDQDPAVFRQRRAAALQAYYEHLPLRLASRPVGPDLQLYRAFRYGDLARFSILDTRQYRSDQACGDGLRVDCADRLDPSRTMLGDTQERWLLDGLAGSDATWNVIGQQLTMAQLDHDPGAPQAFGMDLWDGYSAARARLLTGIRERGVNNAVVIAGDVHRSLAADLKEDFDDPGSPTVGVEFSGTSISSGGDGADMDPLGQAFLDANEHIRFHNAQRGYVRCSLSHEEWRTDYLVLPFVTRPGSPISTRASFVVETSRPGLQSV